MVMDQGVVEKLKLDPDSSTSMEQQWCHLTQQLIARNQGCFILHCHATLTLRHTYSLHDGKEKRH